MRTYSVVMVVAVISSMLLLSACASTTTEQKYEHLRAVAEEGADAHFALINENKPTTKEVCTEHYDVFAPDMLAEDGMGNVSPEWRQLVLDYFVDSCVKGEPRVIQTRPKSTPPVPASPSGPGTSVSAP